MSKKPVMLFLFALILLTACNTTPSPIPATDTPVISTVPPLLAATSTDVPATEPPVILVDPAPAAIVLMQQAVLDRSFEVIAALKDQDMDKLSTYVHPVDGLRFSPYAYVSDTDQVFPPDQVAALPIMSRTFPWGTYSGSGKPIDESWYQYYSEFVFDKDFTLAPEISLNHRLGVSTSMDKIFEYYQSSMYVEFHFPAFDPALQGMDWRSLRLVFTQYNGAWYLVGIIHDQWTT